MKIRFKQILFLLFLMTGCQEAAQNFFKDPLVLNDGSQNQVLRRPKVTSVKYEYGAMIIEGERLDRITTLTFQNKPMILQKRTDTKVWAVAKEKVDLFINEVVSLVVDSAYGQSIVPIDIQLNGESISSMHIKNQSIEEEDLKDKAVGYQKIATNGAVDGDVLTYSSTQGSWIPSASNTSGAGGGGIASLSLGEGMVGKGDVINNTGNILVNTGNREGQIPIVEDNNSKYYGKISHQGDLVLDYDHEKDLPKLKFWKDASDYFSFQKNDESLNIKHEDVAPMDILELSKTQSLFSVPLKITKSLNVEENVEFSGGDSEFTVTNKEVSISATNKVSITTPDFDVSGVSNFSSSVTISANLDVTGDLSANNFGVGGGDYAEYFRSESLLEPGDVVGINLDNGLVRRYQNGDELIGVITTNPGVLGNKNETGEFIAPVALVGQVPVKKDQVVIKGRRVFSKDHQSLGILLNNGLVFLKISP